MNEPMSWRHVLAAPVVDVRETHVEVWWCPPPLGHHYRVLVDHWDYKHNGLPVRFVSQISEG